jgi:N,N'-diacetyllegionaminate synthase
MSGIFQGRYGPLLIAEIGGNHEGNFDDALRLADLAIASGADVIKFQLYTGDTLVSPVEAPDRHRHFQRFELSRAQHIALAERVMAAGRHYLASVWDLDMLDWIDSYLPFYKIGSGDLSAYPLLKAFAERGKAIVLSTGLSSLAEVMHSVRYLQSINPIYQSPEKLALLQCTSLYPTADQNVHLRAMDTLLAASGLSVGYSDHSIGDLALFVAAARGAQVLEFHFTDQREGKTFRDHAVSLTCEEVKRLCERLTLLRDYLGSAEKLPLAAEISAGHVTSFRRAVYCRRDLRAGDILQAQDLVVLRPNHGVDARAFDAVIGRRVANDTPAFAALVLRDD